MKLNGALVKNGEYVRNNNGERMTDFCLESEFKMGNILFQRKKYMK